MRLCAICVTYKRPAELAVAVASFLRQTYADKELIVLDDAGQYAPTALDHLPEKQRLQVKLVTTPHRFRTLGEKRNASAALASPDADVLLPWDDDDIYLSWHMEAAAKAIEHADYTIPTKIWLDRGTRLQAKENSYLFHGAWAFRCSAFAQVNGYPWIQSGQDQGLLKRFKEAGLRRADPITVDPRPSYVYRWFTSHNKHISAASGDKQKAYLDLAALPAPHVAKLEPKWSKDWEAMAK